MKVLHGNPLAHDVAELPCASGHSLSRSSQGDDYCPHIGPNSSKVVIGNLISLFSIISSNPCGSTRSRPAIALRLCCLKRACNQATLFVPRLVCYVQEPSCRHLSQQILGKPTTGTSPVQLAPLLLALFGRKGRACVHGPAKTEERQVDL